MPTHAEAHLFDSVRSPTLRFSRMMFVLLQIASVSGARVNIDWSGIYDGEADRTASANVCDTITFSWTDYHNIYKSANANDYEACRESGGEMMASGDGGGSYSVTFDKPGTHYYICVVGNHCSGSWQKVAITVEGSASTDACGGNARGSTDGVDGENNSNTGVLVGAIAGGVVGGLALVGVGWWVCRRRGPGNKSQPRAPEPPLSAA